MPDEGARYGGPLAVSCRKVGFRYPDAYPGEAEPALADVSFGVRRGEYVGIVGPNGGGKSTLVRLLNGLLVAEEGRVRVMGLDPATEPFEVRKKLGMLFQNPENGLVAPLVEDDVAFGLENLGVERGEMRTRVAEAIRAVGLAGYERREPHTLSGGEKQRVAFAGVLAVGPEVLVLDEPTSMLDAGGRAEVLERVHALRGTRTILHVTHHLEELLDADRILVLNSGRLVADVSPHRLVSDEGLLRENRLVLPTVLRLAAGLGLLSSEGTLPRSAEELGERVRERVGGRLRPGGSRAR